MNHELMIAEVIERTIKAGGTTFDMGTQSFVTSINSWFYPKYPGITQIVPVSELDSVLAVFISSNKELLSEKNCYLGTWLNPESQRVYLDVTTYQSSLENALFEAREISEKQGRKIVTVYNPFLKETKYVWEDVKI